MPQLPQLRKSVRPRGTPLAKLPPPLNLKAQQMQWRLDRNWEHDHDRPVPPWLHALHGGHGKRLCLYGFDTQRARRMAARRAGKRSWQARSNRDLEGELVHLRSISRSGVRARQKPSPQDKT